MTKRHLTQTKRFSAIIFLLTIVMLATAPPTTMEAAVAVPGIVAAKYESEARGALEGAFQKLQSGDYVALYEALPAASRRRVSRARFVSALERTRGMYELERLEIGSVHVAGDLAVADTVVYGRVLRPLSGEGKIIARQYMVREGGQWRVTTGERSTVGPLLAAHPGFARQFPPRTPRILLKQNGRWVDASSLAAAMRRNRRAQQ